MLMTTTLMKMTMKRMATAVHARIALCWVVLLITTPASHTVVVDSVMMGTVLVCLRLMRLLCLRFLLHRVEEPGNGD
jgi:hypothetical protein